MVPFYPRKKLKVYYGYYYSKSPQPVRGRRYLGWYRRNATRFHRIYRVVESVATLDPPIRPGLPRMYFTVKYSGRDWDYGELNWTKEQADERWLNRRNEGACFT
jgi:hypothetical protein